MGCLPYFIDSLSDINLSVFSTKNDEYKKSPIRFCWNWTFKFYCFAPGGQCVFRKLVNVLARCSEVPSPSLIE